MRLTNQEIQAIKEAFETSQAPLTARRICKKVLGTERKTVISLCDEALKNLAEQGKAFTHPPVRHGYPLRYWHKDEVYRVRVQIESIVSESTDPPTITQTKRKIAKAGLPWFDEAVGRLLNENRLFEITLKGARRLSFHPPKAGYVLSSADLRGLERIVRKTESCRRWPVAVQDILRLLEKGSEEISTRARTPSLTESLLNQWYEEEKAALRGATAVSLPSTWYRYEKWCERQGAEPNLSEFHGLLQKLSQDQAVELVPHSRSHPIPEREQRLLLRGPRGETIYFWRWLKRREK